MGKVGPKKQNKLLLRLWKDDKGHPLNIMLPFEEIIFRAERELNIEKRTAINYLNSLVEKETLEKVINKVRKTYYKPKNQVDLTKELMIEWIEKLGPRYQEILDYIEMETIDLMCNFEETRRKKPSAKFSTIIKKTSKTMIELYETKEEIDRIARGA